MPDGRWRRAAVMAPPTDEDVARTIVEDPYGWIQDHMESDLPETPEQKARREEQGRPLGRRPYAYYYRNSREDPNAAALKAVKGYWEQIADAGRDDLHIPRHIKWAVLPRYAPGLANEHSGSAAHALGPHIGAARGST